MKPTSPLGWALFVAGVGALGVGGYYAFKNRSGLRGGMRGARGLGKGRYVENLAPLTPLIKETSAGGMRIQHRRSEKMPIEERVRIIQDKVWESIQDPRMRKLALELTYNCPERDGMCEAKAIYDAMKRRIRYTGDVAPVKMGANGPVEAVDFYQSAYRTWEFKGGDCDDHSILGATLLALNGITPRLRVTADGAFADWGHIYVVAGMPKLSPKKWVALDTTLPGNNKFNYEVGFTRNLDFKVPTDGDYAKNGKLLNGRPAYTDYAA